MQQPCGQGDRSGVRDCDEALQRPKRSGYRRGLLGQVDDEYLLGYGTNHEDSGSLLAEAAEALVKRLPGPDVAPEQLRATSWWQGPEIFVLNRFDETQQL